MKAIIAELVQHKLHLDLVYFQHTYSKERLQVFKKEVRVFHFFCISRGTILAPRIALSDPLSPLHGVSIRSSSSRGLSGPTKNSSLNCAILGLHRRNSITCLLKQNQTNGGGILLKHHRWSSFPADALILGNSTSRLREISPTATYPRLDPSHSSTISSTPKQVPPSTKDSFKIA